jgi:hypothetical protein
MKTCRTPPMFFRLGGAETHLCRTLPMILSAREREMQEALSAPAPPEAPNFFGGLLRGDRDPGG